MILWVAPAVAALGLACMVRVSARARTSQEANQLGGAVILPLIFLAVGQASGLLLVAVAGRHRRRRRDLARRPRCLVRGERHGASPATGSPPARLSITVTGRDATGVRGESAGASVASCGDRRATAALSSRRAHEELRATAAPRISARQDGRGRWSVPGLTRSLRVVRVTGHRRGRCGRSSVGRRQRDLGAGGAGRARRRPSACRGRRDSSP